MKVVGRLRARYVISPLRLHYHSVHHAITRAIVGTESFAWEVADTEYPELIHSLNKSIGILTM